MSTIRVAIAGVGNCASSLIQGVEYYRDADPTETVPGPHARGAGRLPRRRPRVRGRLRRRRGQGRHRPGQGHLRRSEQHHPVRRRGRARGHRAAGPDPRRVRQVLPRDGRGVAGRAGRRGGRPPGRPGPTCWSATSRSAPSRPSASTPTPASRPGWASSTPSRCSSPPIPSGPGGSGTPALPIVGDDIKSQVGSTIVHRILTRLFEDRGLALDHTYQLNVGGNMDFKNMLERDRLESKKVSKTQAVTSQIEHGTLPADDVHIGPSDHVPVAARPQVGLHPDGGPQLRRRAAQPRAEARGVGLPQLGRRHHRRRALRQAGPRPGHRRPAPRPVGLLHEVAAGAVPRRRLPTRWSRRSPPGTPSPVWPED